MSVDDTGVSSLRSAASLVVTLTAGAAEMAEVDKAGAGVGAGAGVVVGVVVGTVEAAVVVAGVVVAGPDAGVVAKRLPAGAPMAGATVVGVVEADTAGVLVAGPDAGVVAKRLPAGAPMAGATVVGVVEVPAGHVVVAPGQSPVSAQADTGDARTPMAPQSATAPPKIAADVRERRLGVPLVLLVTMRPLSITMIGIVRSAPHRLPYQASTLGQQTFRGGQAAAEKVEG